ncbi:response regulator transcription factor [Prescottella agglutinans]|uniref:Two-component system OmpR family response regulator n=1 Tax=Prescottella agglutinans TaxID=1644129 RepID=A0ABT6MGC4_9NOCA|nr:response regulator transcription factor [Prescottella agglutinans]MDH6282935.1 two-component system OmpR family response regulator [Prescottella agglutinans]
MRVLIVDDEQRFTEVLERGLREAGHEVVVRHTGPDGLHTAGSEVFDAVVLDWMLPGQDGPSVCRELRRRGIRTPVLLLTARHAVPDRIAGLDAGADDYLPKPFSFDELLARLRALGRRLETPMVFDIGDLHVDCERRIVTRAGTRVELTAREFDVLALLAGRAGKLVTRSDILEEVWDGETDLRSNVIDVYIANLRTKVDRPFARASIQTLRGAGYRLDDTSD